MKCFKYLLLIFPLFVLMSCGDDKPNHAQEAEAATAEGKILWLDIEEIEKRMKDEPKKVIVDGYTSWCGWCKRMDVATFAHKDIVPIVNENFYAFKFNCERKDTINFKGKEYTFVKRGRKGNNTLAPVLLNGRLSYPTISFLDESLNVIQAFPGAKTADKFDGMMAFINEDHYKSQSYNAFAATYKSEVVPIPLRPKRK